MTPSQAGELVACDCGKQVEVPPFSRLREYPLESDSGEKKSAWGFRQGALSLGVFLAFVIAAVAGWFALNEPAPPKPFDAEARQAVVEQNLASVDPSGLWQLWANFYEPMTRRGFLKASSPQEAELLAEIDRMRASRNQLLAASGAVLLVSGVVFFASPKPSQENS